MVKCHICHAPVLAGWVCGIVPAGDTMKLGLCEEHDTPDNRELVRESWAELLQNKVRQSRSLAERETTKRAASYEVRIRYMDGGLVTVPCRAYDVSKDRQLLVLKQDGEFDFYPLEHIRQFTVVERFPELEEEDSGAPRLEE